MVWGKGKFLSLVLAACLGAGPAVAGPRLVVSHPALHSLVAALSEGVGEPELLYPVGSAPSAPLDALQKAELITADMIFWVGPGLEPDLARTFARMPSLAGKAMAVSNDIPLLARTGYVGPLEDRQATRALEFWTDPRLAIHAVGHITPHLVQMDPEHQEVYLDNEIALVARLRGLEQDIAAELGSAPHHPGASLAGGDPYFAHRFLGGAFGVAEVPAAPVATPGVPASACAVALSATAPPGPDYYFWIMQGRTRALACAPDTQETETAGQPIAAPSGSS